MVRKRKGTGQIVRLEGEGIMGERGSAKEWRKKRT